MTLARASLLALAAVTMAPCAEVSLPKSVAAPDSSLVIPMSFAARSGVITGLQFDLHYDSPAFGLGATVGDAARNSGKTLYQMDVGPGQKRFLILGLNRNPMVDGILINLFSTVSSGAAAGAHPLKLQNVVASGQDGESVSITGTDGVITVQGAAGSGSRLSADGVLNGASLVSGSVAPGEIITLIGAGIGPTEPKLPTGAVTNLALGGMRVQFDGIPAPLLYASAGQIYAIAPYGLGTKTSAQIQIVRESGPAVVSFRLPVVEASPAIFTIGGSGVGAGAILNQDLTVNLPSVPAEKGSVVIIFASGAGETDPAGVDGQLAESPLPKPKLPVTVQIGGKDAAVLYAGAAPGMVAGVLQVNCVVPPDSPSGYTVPVLLNVGKFSSQAGVTVAIQ